MQKLNYNGWTNYETWNYKLWLDNDEKSYNSIQSLVNSVIETEREKDQVFKMSELLKMECLDKEPNLKPSFYSDVLSASLKEVNFYEIAEAYIEDNREERKLITQKQVDEEIKKVKGLFKQAQKIVKSSQA